MWAVIIFMTDLLLGVFFSRGFLNFGGRFLLFIINSFRESLTQTEVVVAAAYHFYRPSLFKSRDVLRHSGMCLVSGKFYAQLSVLVVAPRVELVVFGQDEAVLEAAFDALDGFGEVSFAA